MLHKIDQYYRYIPLKKGFKGSLLPLFGGLLLVLFTFITVQSTHAAPGIRQTINFQGKLVDDQGLNVVDTTYSVVFTLYDAPSGGAQLWQETRSVPTVDGIFREELGDTVSLATVDFGDDSLYLGIKVGSDPEMTPRVRFTASPYAFQARNVAWSGLQDAIDDLSVSMGSYTSTFTYGNNTGANDLFVLQDTANNTGTGRLLSLQTATGSSLSPFHVSAGGVEALIVEASGNVGIGTTDPTQKLDIAGTVRIRGQLYDYNNQVGTPGQVLSTTANGVDWIDASTVGTDNQTLANVYSQAGNTVQLTAGFGDIRFYRGTNTEMLFLDESSGNVGIGTTNPLSLFSIGSTSQFQINSTGVVTSGTWQGSVISSTYLDPAVILATQIDTYSELNTLVSDVTLTHNGLIDTSAELAGIVGDETGTGALVFANSPTFAGNVLFPGSGIWNSTGNVGIGTTAPGYKLDVNGDIRISSGSELYSFGSATLGNRTYTEDNYVTDGQTFTASIDALDQQVSDLVGGVGGVWSRNSGSGYLYPQTITDSVSVGHSLPVARLDVAGTAWLRGGTGNTTGLFVDTNGRVGLGITNPSAQLHIGSNTTPNITIDGYAASATASPALSFRRSRGTLDSPSQTLANDRLGQIAFGGTNDLGAFTSQIAAIAGFSSENFTTTAQGSYIRFDTTGMGTTTRLERMRLTSEGYLGIGTTSPTSKLDVLGTTWLRGGTGNTTGLYVNSSGNVGIGFTNPNGALQVTGDEVRIGAGGTITSATGDGDLYVQDVLEVDSLAGSGTRAVYVDANGVLTATGGTSGIIGYFQRNGTTLTPATVTDNLSVGSTTSTSATLYVPGSTNNNAWFSLGTGNLGIGTTSPGAKLDVQGGGAIIQTFLRLDRNDDPTNNKILFGSGADTNLYRSAANTLRTNDSLIVDGNVGIGTTNPSFPLVITGDVNTGLRSMMNNLSTGNQAFTEFNIANGASVIDSLAIGTIGENANFGGSFGPDTAYISAEANITNGLSILTKASSAIRFYTNGFSDSNERLRITSTGLVGIGTTAPASLLDVAGTTWLRGGTGNTTGLYVNGSGNVGIGTTSPVSLLHVGANLNGGGSSIFGVTIDPLLRTTNTNGLNQTAVVINPTFNTTSSNVANAYGLRISPTHTGTYTTTNAYGLYVDATTISSGALTNSYAAVFNGGNVGIGTTSPGSRLEVNAGASTDALKLLSTTNTRLRIDSTGASATPGIDFQSSGSGVWSTYLNIPDSSLRFWKGADRVIFDTNGNVGIGSTITSSRLNLYSSVSNGSVSDELRIQTYRSDFSTLAGSSILFKNQDSNNAVNEARIQVVTANDTSIGLNNEGSSSFIFNMTNGGVAADRVIFRADGNVGIGTTNPGASLDVVGNIRTDSRILTSDGAVDKPAYRFTSDADVGMYRPGTNTLSLVTGGVDRIYINSSGNVGVGISNPGSRLTVANDGSAGVQQIVATLRSATSARPTLLFTESTSEAITAGMSLEYDGRLSGTANMFNINAIDGLPVFSVRSGGNVGIGTTNPGYRLDVNGDIRIATGSELYSNGSATLGNRTYTTPSYVANGQTFTASIQALDNAVEGIAAGGSGVWSRNTTSGYLYPTTIADRVGIGTTSPGGKLQVGDGTGTISIRAVDSTGTIALGAESGLMRIQTDGTNIRFLNTANGYAPIQASVGKFETNANSFFVGNLGIGTTNPQNKLDIADASGVTVRLLDIGSHSFSLATPNNVDRLSITGGGGGQTGIHLIGSSGNVGIGITNPLSPLHVVGNQLRWDSSTTSTDTGILFMAGTDYAEIRAGQVGNYSIEENLSLQAFGGNVGIGTTSPQSKLAVSNGGANGVEIAPGVNAFGLSNINYITSYDRANTAYRDLVFDLNSTPALMLKSNGTVGIGTTSTITTLDVNGDVAVRGGDIYMESLGASGIRISADTTNTNIGFLDSGAAVQTLHGSIGIDDSYANARANLTSLGGNSLAVDGKGYFSGNVGIGTTNPSSPLHVTGSARTDTNFIVSSRVNLGPGVGASDGRLLSVGNLELGTTNAYPGTGAHMMLTTGGNVGIGTTNPGAKLEVVNTTGTSLYLTGTNGNATSLIQFRESNTNAGVELFYDGANDEISFRNISDSLNLMTIERNGRVGIGTTAPGYELQVVGTGRFTTSVATNKLDVWGVASGETFMEVGDGSIGSVVYSMERAPTGGMSNEIALKAEFGPLTLWGGASGTPSRVMTLLSSGNVGIGTTGPGAKLEVVGIAESATVPGTASGYNIAIGNASNTTNYYKGGIGFNDGTAVPASILFVDEGPSGAAGIALATGNNSTIAERLRVSTTGNVGIGTTNPATILNVGGATNKSISVDSTSNRAFYGAYQDAAVLGVNRDPAVGTFYSTGKASSYISLIGAANNGYIDFLATNTNNTNPPSRMRITGDGNLGIGTTSPSAQLSVVGNAGQSNLLSIRDENNQDVLSATASKITSAVPHEFLATGNVSMAYDLIFTNQSNAAIKSNGPLEIVAGEVFENQNLTLKTYNAGKLIIESSNIWADGTNVGIGTTNPQTKLDVSGYLGFATTTFNQFVKTGGRGIALNNGNDIEWLGSTYSNGYGHRLYSIDPGFGSRTELRLATRNNSGTWTDRLSIESSGDIGIGTTDPTHMLDVNGNLGVEGRLYVGNDTNYLSYPTGSYGTIQVNGSGAGGWEGYSIDGRSVFMHDGSNTTGIYNDVDNEWMFYGVNNSYTEMRYNGLTRIQTSNAGASVTGALTATSFAGNGSSLTSLNASNLSSGTVADARITGSYTGLTNLTGSGTFTAGNAYISSNGIRVGTTDLQGFHYSNGSGNLYIGGANSQDGDLIINNSAGASRIELRAFDQTQIMKNSSGTTTLQLSGSDTIQSYINSSYGLVVGATSQSEAKTTFVGSVPSNSWTNVKIDSTTSASNAGVYSLENNFTHSTAITGSVGVAMYGQYNTVSKSGADSTTGHTQVYGIYANGTNLPTVNAGTRTAYGGYFRAQGNANGTSTTYGVYCEALGADTNRCGGNQAWTNVSDMRVKTDIELITSALDKISAINGVSFRRTDDGSTRRHIGFLAQQVLPHVPEVVLYDEAADRYSMEYSSLTALLVEGVKEQQGQILDIDMRIDDLGDTLGIQLTDTGDVLSTVLEETNIELAQQTVMIDQINIEKNVLAETVNSLTDTIQQLTTRLDKTDEVISETQTDVENIDARVTALEQFFAGTMSTDSASLFLSPSASVSAQIARSITDTEVIIDKKLISEDDLTVLGTLSATDISAVGTISSGLLTINGFDDTTATPSATITTLGGELKLQHDGMNGIDMIAGKVKVDINGNVLVYQGGVNIAQGDLTIQEGSIKGSESIRGIDVVVDQGALTYDVVFNSPNDTDSYAVSILPTWFTAVLIEEKTVDGFKVRFNSPAPANARLDWIIIE